MTEREFETLTNRLFAASVVLFVLLGLAAFFSPAWGYVAAAWGGMMAPFVYRWYAELLRSNY